MKKFLSLFMLLCTMQSNLIYSMQTAINLCSKFVNAQSIASHAKSLSTGAFFGPTIGLVVMSLFGEKIFSNGVSHPVDAETANSIKQKLKDLNYPERMINKLEIRKGSRAEFMALKSTLIIPTDETKKINQFELAHEGAHIYQKHTLKYLLASCISSAGIHLLANKLNDVSGKYVHMPPFFQKPLFQAFGALAICLPIKLMLNHYVILLGFRKFQEYQADQEGLKRTKDLDSIEKFAKEIDGWAKRENNMGKEIYGKWINNYPELQSFLLPLDSSHPNSQWRAKYLRKTLKEKQKRE